MRSRRKGAAKVKTAVYNEEREKKIRWIDVGRERVRAKRKKKERWFSGWIKYVRK